jgi:very-short-patch-repair endonuclease
MVAHDELEAAALEHHRTKGANARAWALDKMCPGADSRPESLLRLLLQEDGYRDLEVNPAVAVEDGRRILHPDLCLPSLRIALEYEGDGHRTNPRQWRADIERRELFEAAGWRVIRVTALDLFHERSTFLERFATVAHSRRMSATEHPEHTFVTNVC